MIVLAIGVLVFIWLSYHLVLKYLHLIPPQNNEKEIIIVVVVILVVVVLVVVMLVVAVVSVVAMIVVVPKLNQHPVARVVLITTGLFIVVALKRVRSSAVF